MRHKMITQRALCAFAIVAAVALVTMVAAMRTVAGAASQAEAATLSGGNYQLSGITWDAILGLDLQASNHASGGHYQLAGLPQPNLPLPIPAVKNTAKGRVSSGGRYQLSAPTGSENGCCCLFLPCMSK